MDGCARSVRAIVGSVVLVMTTWACARGEDHASPAPADGGAAPRTEEHRTSDDPDRDAREAPHAPAPPRAAPRSAPPLASAALTLDDGTVCVPASWTQGSVRYGRDPACREAIAPGARLGDGGAPCDGCAFEPNEAVTRRERRAHSDACCFTKHGSRPSR